MEERDFAQSNPFNSYINSPKGKNYLLAIAINDYKKCSKLKNAVKDAEAFIEVLIKRYNFESEHITLIKDAKATKKRIESAFDRLIDTVTEKDNLIIYFSGHGRHHERRGGFWIPVEAGTGDAWSDYLSNGVIKHYLSKINSFHTFLIADSCFSGSLFIDKSKEKYTGDRRDTEPSRWGLTSGKKEIVSDGEPGQHSPFATALLDVLHNADRPPTVMYICNMVLEKVVANAQQTPMGSPLQVPGHQGGQMVFYFRMDEEADWLKLNKTVEGCKVYLNSYPEGKYRSMAEEIIAAKAWEEAKATKLRYILLNYERDYPNSQPVISGELHRIIAELDEEQLWIEASKSNTVSAYQNYLIRSTLKLHASNAEIEIRKIIDKERYDVAGQKEFTLPRFVSHEDTHKNPDPVSPLHSKTFGQTFYHYILKKHILTGSVLILGVMIFIFLVERACNKNQNPPLNQEKRYTLSPIDMVPVKGGHFEMGDVFEDNPNYNEEAIHSVFLNDFKIAKHEVTFVEFDFFCKVTGRENPKDEGWGRGSLPVINVTWYDAIEYCNWRSLQDNLQPVYQINGKDVQANWEANGYRLPTEAEWEYAARDAGQKVRFGNGKNEANPLEINFDGSKEYKRPYSILGINREKTIEVGSLKSTNSLGLSDMSGNVSEWCWDWYKESNYNNESSNNPRGPEKGDSKVVRGGSWSDTPFLSRASNRISLDPNLKGSVTGFRLVRQ